MPFKSHYKKIEIKTYKTLAQNVLKKISTKCDFRQSSDDDINEMISGLIAPT